ncbi:hypothetical protein [Nodularia sp. UHCC 0506]|uniref:hypothetical protein n=1 Tax=Nodularia sp. UHCC 0506 TaxID=3110243 RepID=UPI002B215DF0|nr:hypothetical protein [Nodularia sp. UHCC 0506]MEA5515186.1 hypothetical protein [Nodularia sp. UHCC 0506]
MFEKLFLAVIITFSLNFFLQVRLLNSTQAGINEPQYNTETSTTIMVKNPKNHLFCRYICLY